MIDPRMFDSDTAWPWFTSLGNYFPRRDLNGLRVALRLGLHSPGCTGRYLEVGSFTGTTAVVALETGFNDIVCIDTWSGGSDASDRINGIYKERGDEVYQTFLRNMDLAGARPTVMRMDSLTASQQPEIKDRSCDVVFLDGDHSHEAVRNDIEAWLPKVRPGGVLCGHDFTFFPGVANALREMVDIDRFFSMGTVWVFLV